MEVPKGHPRYVSLMTRHKLVDGFEAGLVAPQGLIAHGRGEAFDYMLGERTTEEAERAIEAAAAALLLASRPVISVNGNVSALVPEGMCDLADVIGCPVEVNIFHRTQERIEKIVAHLRGSGCTRVMGDEPDAKLPGLDHPRAICCREGIFSADVVLVPLEDGDRCEALKRMGKVVIAIDLNPLSRTAKAADITIVDNIVRAVPRLIAAAKEMKGRLSDGGLDRKGAQAVRDKFSNRKNLNDTLARMYEGLILRYGTP